MKIVILFLAILAQSKPSDDERLIQIGTKYESLRAYMDGIEMIESGEQMKLNNFPKACTGDQITELKMVLHREYLTIAYSQNPSGGRDKLTLAVRKAKLSCLAQISEMVLAHRLRHQQSSIEYAQKLMEAVMAYQETRQGRNLSDPLFTQASETLETLLSKLAAK